MKINDAGLKLIKDFEGLRLVAYRCSAEKLTIGYGHVGSDVYQGREITKEEAEDILDRDLRKFEIGVTNSVKVPLTSNQFSALVSFAFNLGLGNLRGSSLLMILNAGNYDGAADQFLRWTRAQGVVLPGLVRRREAERALFLTPDEVA